MKKRTNADQQAASANGAAAASTPLEVAPDTVEIPETDFRRGRRNPFYAGLPAGSRRAVIQPDVAAVFADSTLVNQALRLLIEVARQQHVHTVEPEMVYGGWLATLDPDVAAVYGNSVNDVLRRLIDVARAAAPAAERAAKRGA